MPDVHSIEDLFSCPVTLVVSQQCYNLPKKVYSFIDYSREVDESNKPFILQFSCCGEELV